MRIPNTRAYWLSAAGAACLAFGYVAKAQTPEIEYKYDALGRVIAVHFLDTERTIAYEYDDAGNRLIAASQAFPSFSVNNKYAREDLDIVFTVTKTGTAAGETRVAYAATSGTATSGVDFIANSGVLTFGPDDTTKTITIETIIDELTEGNETFTLELSDPVGATISDGAGDGTVIDAAVIKVTDVSADEGDTLDFHIERTGRMDGTVRVDYTTTNGSAVAPGDYTTKSDTRYMVTDETYELISVSTKTDQSVEGSEVVYLDVTFAGGGSVIVDSRGDGTINNVNAAPTAVNDNWGNEELFDTFTVNVLNNDTDPENDTLTIQPLSGIPSGLTVTRISGNTALSIESYSTGSYNFSYTISDGNGNTDTATVSGVIDPQDCPGDEIIC